MSENDIPRTARDLRTRGAQAAKALAELIERMELYPINITDEEQALIYDWLSEGYSLEEILDGMRRALRDPRPAHTPPRGVRHGDAEVRARLPSCPTPYARRQGAFDVPPTLGAVIFLRVCGRIPRSHEAFLIDAALRLFPDHAVEHALALQHAQHALDVWSLETQLYALYDMAHQAALEEWRKELALRDAIRLYVNLTGREPSWAMTEEMRALIVMRGYDASSWRMALQHGLRIAKESPWEHARRWLWDAQPLPKPVNAAAALGCHLLKTRLNKALTPRIAEDINALALRVTNPARWTRAFEMAIVANRPYWSYVRSILNRLTQVQNDDDVDCSGDSSL